MVTITATGIYPSGKTELSKRNGAILLPWDLFPELKDWCNLLYMRLVGLETHDCQINLVYGKVSSLPLKVPCMTVKSQLWSILIQD